MMCLFLQKAHIIDRQYVKPRNYNRKQKTTNMINIVLLGPPAAGKGTQIAKITEHYDNLIQIGPGELMRSHVKKKTPLGEMISDYINQGMLAPTEIVIGLVEEQMRANQEGTQFLLDGFPRSMAQAKPLDELLEKYDHPLDGVIFLEVPDSIVKKRIQKRAQSSKRADDQREDCIAKRLQVYHEETLPVIRYYEKQNKLYKVPGVGSIEDVFARIMDVVKTIHQQQ